MQTLALHPFSSSAQDESPPLNVCIAYEDFETGKRAMKTYNYLVEHLGHECHFANQMWKFDVLSVPKLREMAVKDAAAAQIVIVAGQGNNPLPIQVKAWIESWMSQAGHAVALVGLFEDLSEFSESPARDYLASVARRGDMEFFCQTAKSDGGKRKTKGDPQRNEIAISALASVIQEQDEHDIAVSRWGINE